MRSRSCPTLCHPRDRSTPGSSSMGFSRQEYCSGLPFPAPGDLSDPRIEPVSPTLAGRFFTAEPPGKPIPNASSVQLSCSVMSRSVVSPMDSSMPGLPVHYHLPELVKPMSTESMMPSNHLILCHSFLLLLLIFPSIKIFSSETVLRIRWPKYWSFSFSISPPNEYSGLISFRMDWLDLFAVQVTLKSLLQHHSSKA